jgi:glycosyltransferase involved in cell wall biosynthesis
MERSVAAALLPLPVARLDDVTATIPSKAPISPYRPPAGSPLELSVVMPCLNEAETLGVCVGKALRAMAEHGIAGEVIVADNGSTDGSPEIAERLGARVVHVTGRGYGNALMGGIAASRGRYVIMGDADDSYDFLEIPKFVARLREGHDLVQGCRLPSGGGIVAKGAMPFLHRWWGNPMFSMMARRWFHTPIHDIYCGMRGFTRELYDSLNQRCTGMEFATEMMIRSSLAKAKIAEVPITLHQDGRTVHPPHLRTFRDGWRTLRFYLMYSPRWLFLLPGALLVLAGAIGYGVAMPGMVIDGVRFDVHTLLFASLAMIVGYQAMWFAVLTKTFAITEGLLPADPKFLNVFKVIDLEKGLLAGGAMIAGGIVPLVLAFLYWRSVGYGALDYPTTLRWVIPGVTATAVGFQTVLSSFFMSILGLARR